jgi:ABC-type branched-subunit amino acid transport system substrate-binding protein
MKPLLCTGMIIAFLIACNPTGYTCTDPMGCLEVAQGIPISIGIIYAGYGDTASNGQAQLNAVETAVAKKSLLLGHEIDLILQATDCTPENAIEAASALASNPQLVAVMGPTCVSEEWLTDPVLMEAGILILPYSLTDSHTEAYLLFSAIEQVAIPGKDGSIFIPRSELQVKLIEIVNR